MTDATEFVPRAEFETSKKQQEERLTPMAIRLDVVSHDTSRLLRDMAGLTEGLGQLRDEVAALREDARQRFDDVDERFERLEKQIADGNAALLSAVLQLAKR